MRVPFLLVLVLSAQLMQAQFEVIGAAYTTGVDTFVLTPNVAWQTGSVWHKLKHDFSTDFLISGELFFGASDAGADGLAFVIQNHCLGAGSSGGGLGYEFMPGNSMAVEFDTYSNSPGAPFDPVYDHMAILQNGIINHSSNIAGPIQIHPSFSNVEDNQWHDFLFHYGAASTTFTVVIDGNLRFIQSIDIENTILAGDPMAYWGFTAATGGITSQHGLIIDSYTAFSLSDTTFCTGSTSTALPPPSTANLALSNSGSFTSSIENAGTQASNAFDGDLGTRWSSAFFDPQWITVDLGTAQDIDGVTLFWEGAYATEYKIQTSTNNTLWTDQHHEIAGNGGTDVINFTATGVRYVRMYGIQRATPYGYSLWEFQVNGASQYAWSPNDGSISDTTIADPIFTPLATTTYSVVIPDDCIGSTTLDFTVTIDCGTLPVEFLDFQGQAHGENVLLHWHTASEKNNAGFRVQRSTDASTWGNIGFVPGMGTTEQTSEYAFLDDDVPNKQSGYFYRLEQVDLNGTIDHSKVVFVAIGEHWMELVVWPNPANSVLHVSGSSDFSGEVRIIASNGQVVHTIRPQENGSRLEFPIGFLSPGVYTIVFANGSARFLKE